MTDSSELTADNLSGLVSFKELGGLAFEAGFSELGIGVQDDRGVHVPVLLTLFSPPIKTS